MSDDKLVDLPGLKQQTEDLVAAIDDKDESTLASAKEHADAKAAANLAAAKDYADSKGSSVLQDAKSYADSGDASTLSSAKGYADEKAAAALRSANDHADQQAAAAASASIPLSQKGAASGVAQLDANGLVPSSQLPSYVDDVIEGESLSALPATGETGKIYVTLDDNKTYRWSGSAYVEISQSLAIGTTDSTAGRGDWTYAAYQHAIAKGSQYGNNLYKITTNAEGHVVAATPVTKDDIVALGIPGSSASYDPATQSADGLMSASDKKKLDGIANGATAVTVDTAISKTSTNPLTNKAIYKNLRNKANLESPTFTGVPQAPTAPWGTSSDQIATTRFVQQAIPEPIYGFDLDMSNPDPKGCVSYTDTNSSYAPACMDYDTGSFDYGDWGDAFFMPKPCMLGFDGNVESYLDPDDYAKNVDGTPSSIADSTTANAMMEWPVIYVSRHQSGDIYHFRCSSAPFEGSTCLANLDNAGETVNFYTPIYSGSLDNDGRLRSLSKRAPSTNENISYYRNAAAANGPGWEIERAVDRLLINDLLVLISKSCDSQSAFGNGTYAQTDSGSMDSNGLFYGAGTGAFDKMKAFGMEHLWGNEWHFLVGWVSLQDPWVDEYPIQKMKLTYGLQDGSAVEGYNVTGEGYIETGATLSGSSGDYISKCLATPYGLIPIEASGSSSTYFCDQMFWSGGDRLAIIGGPLYGQSMGAWCVSFQMHSTGSTSTVGAALSYK